jgi:pilus assembly protein CpaC
MARCLSFSLAVGLFFAVIPNPAFSKRSRPGAKPATVAQQPVEPMTTPDANTTSLDSSGGTISDSLNSAAEASSASAPEPQNTDSSSLQASASKILVTRGRSQIVRFAQPVARLSIADPSLADIIPLAPDQIMINGKLRGTTSLIVWDENGQEGIFDLNVRNDATELMEAVQNIAPNENVQAHVTDDSFILSGAVSSAMMLDEIRKTASAYGYRDDHFIDLTDTPVPQITLDVRMAEANRSVGRILKTSFGGSGSSIATSRVSSNLDTTVLGKLPLSNGLTPGRAGAGIAPQDIINSLTSTNIGGNTGFYRGKSFSAVWDLLETSGQLNTLANPSLVCTHGRTASFLAGGEYPFVGGVSQASGSPIIQFKEFGVKLKFTPWISPVSGRIEIQVAPEVSSLDNTNCVTTNGSPVCGILKRSTDTTVQLADGESLMISGILNREEQKSFQKVPFIGNVPVLGAMFKNSNTVKNDRELVVIITPHILKKSPTATP